MLSLAIQFFPDSGAPNRLKDVMASNTALDFVRLHLSRVKSSLRARTQAGFCILRRAAVCFMVIS